MLKVCARLERYAQAHGYYEDSENVACAIVDDGILCEKPSALLTSIIQQKSRGSMNMSTCDRDSSYNASVKCTEWPRLHA